MHAHTRLAALTIATAALVALCSGGASASRAIELSPAGEVSASGTVRISESEGLVRIECEFALTGSLSTRITKAIGAVAGMLTSYTFRNCLDNFMRPWTVRAFTEMFRPALLLYASYLGTLPSIAGILVVAQRVTIQTTLGETSCIYFGNLPFLISRAPGELKFNRKMFQLNRVNLVEGRGCGRESWIEFSGTLALEPAQEAMLLS